MIVVFGYAFRHPDEPCAINVDQPTRTLCGRYVESLPGVQAFGRGDGIPVNLHERCRQWMDVLGALVQSDDMVYGVCPVCQGDVALADGLVSAHGEWVVGRHGWRMSQRPCSGAGERPEVQP